jgi:DNA-binding response OmpR family regulator
MMSARPDGASFNFSKASVLVIDANALFLDLLTGVLQGFGFRRIQRCPDIEAGALLLKARAFDLILIDPYPNNERAYELIRELRDAGNANSGAPILIVTGHTYLRLVADTRQCGADFVIAKPFSMGGLLERVLWVAKLEGRRGGLLAPEAPSGRVFGAQPW